MPSRATLRRLAWAFLATLPLAGCRGSAARPEGDHKPTFRDVTRESGIHFVHRKPRMDPRVENIAPWLSSVGASVAVADVDGDGRLDLFFTSSGQQAPCALYRALGGLRYADRTAQSRLDSINSEQGVAMAAVFADYDNDGDPDLYIVKWGRNRLLRNDGKGVFEDVTDASGVGDAGNGNGAVFLDYDRDGHLDLYVANYFPEVDLWHPTTTCFMHDDFERSRNGGTNRLYHNQGDGTFREVAVPTGVADTGWTLAVGSADVDGDGWPDLYSANDFGTDHLFLNRRDGSFEEATRRVLGFDTKKGMNVDFGDFDNDGWLDVYVTNITKQGYLEEGNMLLHNIGGRTLVNVAAELGCFDGGWGWGAKFLDYDNDGDLDILAENGFISQGPESYWEDLARRVAESMRDPEGHHFDIEDATAWPPIGDRSQSGYEPARLFRNDEAQTFHEVAAREGITGLGDGRGVAVADLDGDGDLDIVIANQGQSPTLYENLGRSALRSLQVDLVGTVSNRDAVGARVEVAHGATFQVREVDGGNGFAGSSPRRLHFGIGAREAVDGARVRWPSGLTEEFGPLRAGGPHRLEEGRGRPASGEGPRVAYRLQPGPAERPAASDPLESLERSFRERPFDLALGNEYRAAVRSAGATARAILFLEELARLRSEERAVAIHLALAYVDELSRPGVNTYERVRLSSASVRTFGRLLEEDPSDLLARYGRGKNYLYWPGYLRVADDAVRDLEAAEAALGARRTGAAGSQVLAALGDALVKDGDLAAARAVYARGQSGFPAEGFFARRAALDDRALRDTVHRERDPSRGVATDIAAFLEAPVAWAVSGEAVVP